MDALRESSANALLILAALNPERPLAAVNRKADLRHVVIFEVEPLKLRNVPLFALKRNVALTLNSSSMITIFYAKRDVYKFKVFTKYKLLIYS